MGARGAKKVVVRDVIAVAAGEAAILYGPKLGRAGLPAGQRFAIEKRCGPLGKSGTWLGFHKARKQDHQQNWEAKAGEAHTK